MNLIHCSDLHLKSGDEKEYSLAVLKEVVDKTEQNDAAALLFCGDTFHNFEEIGNLQKAFREQMRRLGECEVFLIAGNHENLRRNGKLINDHDLGIPRENIIDTDSAPYRLIKRDGLEILAIPHQQSYKDYMSWLLPEPTAVRVAMAHATIPAMVYTGFNDDEEEATAALDTDLFVRHKVSYAALGHIHSGREMSEDGVMLVYPGSSRVVSKNEEGDRRIRLIRVNRENATLTHEPLALLSAGKYKGTVVDFPLSGLPEPDTDKLSPEMGDWIHFELNGLVEDRAAVEKFRGSIEKVLKNRIRKVTFEDNIESCGKIAESVIARKFLEAWESKSVADVGDALEIHERARMIGLKSIMAELERQA